VAIEYAVPGLAEVFADAGVRYAKPQPIYGLWSTIEPERGTYDWKPLDALVTEYQGAGITGIQMLLTSESSWAQVRQPAGLDKGDTFPQEAYLDDYAAFVRNTVERYDGDGVDDMPGLLAPIHHWGVEREFTGYWPSGSADDYVRLLRIAYREIHAADPEAEVLLVALLLLDIFDGAPPQTEVERRLAQKKILSYSLDKVRTIMAACDAYDVLDLHSLGDYSEIPPTAAWVRAEMAANGCGERPIWLGDAFSMSGLIGYADPFGIVPSRTFAPATDKDREAVIDLLMSVAEPDAEGHAEAVAWLRGEMARGLVKKIVVSAAECLAGINLGNMEDWTFPQLGKANAALVRSMGTPLFMGMLDTTVTRQVAGGPLQKASGGAYIARIRRVDGLRPAYHALALAIEKTEGFTSVKRLALGEGVWAYRYERPKGPAWVLWYDDGALHLPDDPPPTCTVELPVDAAQARVTWTPTEVGEESRRSEKIAASGGTLSVAIDATPVFVEIE
jgi:hypothetical protein